MVVEKYSRPGMSGGGKDLALQLSRQRELETLNTELEALDAEPSGDEQEHDIVMSSQELEGNSHAADAHGKDNTSDQYLIVTFPNSDQEYRVDLSRTMDAGDVGRNFSARLGNKPARDVLDHDATGKRKRKPPKLVETGQAEYIGEGWTYKTYQRRNGATEGQTDTYWFSPVLKKKFRSRQEISRFLELYRHARGSLADDPVVLGMIDKREGGRLEAIAWDQVRASTDADSNSEKDEQHPWENRIRAGLQEAKYTGDTDAMVSKVLAKLTSMIDPDGPGREHGGFKRMTKYLLDDVVHRLNKEEKEGVPFDDSQVPIPKKRCVDQEEIPRKTSLPPIGEFNYWLFALVHFKKLHGHIDVACHLQTDKEMRLLAFAEDLKQRYNENKIDPSTLSPSQLEALTSIGYDLPNFIPNEKRKHTWSERIEQLKSFKAKNGHCNVTLVNSDEFPGLFTYLGKYRWEFRQKRKAENYNGFLTDAKEEELTALGFCLSETRSISNEKRKYTWSERIEQLKSFKAKNGHCSVTLVNSDEFPGLFLYLGKYRWEFRQKRKAENYNGFLTNAKAEELTALGFCLSETLRGAALTFDERVTQLRLFKEKHGHCNPMPSQSGSEFPGLARWCYQIKKHMKKKRAGEGGPLSDEKEQELRDIGFVFTSDVEGT